MTMPHLMNCIHSDDGWCLNCVEALHDEKERIHKRCIEASINGSKDNITESVAEMLADLSHKHIDELESERDDLRKDLADIAEKAAIYAEQTEGRESAAWRQILSIAVSRKEARAEGDEYE